MTPTWTAEDTEATTTSARTRLVIDHLDQHVALDEAAKVLDALDAGDSLGETISHQEALARFDQYC